MNIKRFLIDSVTVFAVTLVGSVFVSLLWDLIAHGGSTLDWETSFRFATIFGIILPILHFPQKPLTCD
jgi:hypothetical protein